MILPKFYCKTCKKFKNRLQVTYRDNTREYWYDCKWCHDPVHLTKDLLQEILGNEDNYDEDN